MFGEKGKKTAANRIDPYLNIGGLFDVPTGHFVQAANGQWYSTGGAGHITSEGGPPNSFKTEIMLYCFLSVLDNFLPTGSKLAIYDSESSLSYTRLEKVCQQFKNLKEIPFTSDDVKNNIILTNDSEMWLDEWFSENKEYAILRSKLSSNDDPFYTTPFMGFDNKPIKMRAPYLGLVDSITKARISTVVEKFDEFLVGTKETNTENLMDAKAKGAIITQMAKVGKQGSIRFGMVAHENLTVDMNGPYAPKEAGLPHAKSGHKFTGASKAFQYLANGLFEIQKAGPLKQSDGTAKYPSSIYDKEKGAVDLNIVPMKIIRNKAGISGLGIDLVISQKEGVKNYLSCFHFVKDTLKGWGINGNDRSYSLDLYPDVKLSRTTVRDQLETDPLLARACELTAQLVQYYKYHTVLPNEAPTPKEIRERLIDKGYDWEKLLVSTGKWNFIEFEDPELPYLSVKDLVEIYLDRLELEHFKA